MAWIEGCQHLAVWGPRSGGNPCLSLQAASLGADKPNSAQNLAEMTSKAQAAGRVRGQRELCRAEVGKIGLQGPLLPQINPRRLSALAHRDGGTGHSLPGGRHEEHAAHGQLRPHPAGRGGRGGTQPPEGDGNTAGRVRDSVQGSGAKARGMETEKRGLAHVPRVQ